MSRFRLTAAQRRRLEQQLQSAGDVGLFRRTLAVLEAGAGRPIAEIVRLLRTSRVSVYQWIDSFEQARGPAGLEDSRGGNHPTLWTGELRAALAATLGHRPDQFGYPAVGWTVPLLREHLERWQGVGPSESSIRQQLRALGYVWKRPRYVLIPDPQREKKTADSPGNPGVAGAVGDAVRGRDGPAAVPALARGVGVARAAVGGADLRVQCPARGVRDD